MMMVSNMFGALAVSGIGVSRAKKRLRSKQLGVDNEASEALPRSLRWDQQLVDAHQHVLSKWPKKFNSCERM